MDEQGLDGAFFFPTLAVGMEEALRHDIPALLAAFRAFNRWLDEDWGFAYRDRIFAAPVHHARRSRLGGRRARVGDQSWWARRRDAGRARAAAPGGRTRSPGDPIYDPFWARAAEAGVVVAFHSGDAGYGRYIDDWEPSGDFKAFQFSPLRGMTSDRAPFDLFAVLTCHGVFHRHPGVKVATIEAGGDWVAPLREEVEEGLRAEPALVRRGILSSQLQDHLWVAPFYEDDIRALADAIGVEHVLFGSDFPHAEGLADPLAFVRDLDGFSEAEVRLIMRDNALTVLNG